jgi:DNA-binding IclR family transcriptional regulator
MNKKLGLLRYLAENLTWHSPGELGRALKLPDGSVSPFLKDLVQAGLVAKRSAAQGRLEYQSKLRFIESDETPGSGSHSSDG